jgi:hypothetical protein
MQAVEELKSKRDCQLPVHHHTTSRLKTKEQNNHEQIRFQTTTPSLLHCNSSPHNNNPPLHCSIRVRHEATNQTATRQILYF